MFSLSLAFGVYMGALMVNYVVESCKEYLEDLFSANNCSEKIHL